MEIRAGKLVTGATAGCRNPRRTVRADRASVRGAALRWLGALRGIARADETTDTGGGRELGTVGETSGGAIEIVRRSGSAADGAGLGRSGRRRAGGCGGGRWVEQRWRRASGVQRASIC